MKRFYGKYRGKVTANADPDARGRLQVTVSRFPALKEAWALPCAPYAGPQVGLYTVPPVGANVWIEFEGGLLDSPIWSGCFWGIDETPKGLGKEVDPIRKVWRTDRTTLVIDDAQNDGGVTLRVDKPAVGIAELELSMTSSGVVLTVKSPVASTVTLTADDITLEHPQAKVKLTAQDIECAVPPASVTITADAITDTVPPGKVEVSATSIVATNSPGQLTVAPTGVEATAGGGKVDITPALVTIGAPLVKIN